MKQVPNIKKDVKNGRLGLLFYFPSVSRQHKTVENLIIITETSCSLPVAQTT
jgi:hypothetical protein